MEMLKSLLALVTETTDTYVVYKAYGKNTNRVYYGYARGDEANVKTNFTAGYNNRSGGDRAERKFVDLNGGELDDVMFDIVDVFIDEYDAWMARNEERAEDALSITGPTMFPGDIAARASRENPERISQWKRRMSISKAKTAREAYAAGAWTKQQLDQLIKPIGPARKGDIVADLDSLTPQEFSTKYSL